jgi:hypothetical protein
LYIFKKLIWWSLSLLQIKPIRKKKSILFKLHYLIYMDVIFIFIIYYCNIIVPLSLITWLKYRYKFEKKNCEEKYIVFWNIQDDFSHENFKIHWLFYKHVFKLSLHYINPKYLNNLENIMNLLNHVCFLHLMNVLCVLQLSFDVCH